MGPSAWSIGLAAVPWLLAIGGWLVANSQANKRETRKELRSEIQDLEKILEKISDQSRAYFSCVEGSPQAALAHAQLMAVINESLFRTERYIHGASRGTVCNESNSANENLAELFDLATGDKLNAALKAGIVQQEDFCMDLGTSVLILTSSIHALFRYRYPAT